MGKGTELALLLVHWHFWGINASGKTSVLKVINLALNIIKNSFLKGNVNEKMKTIRVVAAVIRQNGKIFATQRGYGEWKDGWEFPGGKIETGETPEEALRREIQEELDTEISVKERIDTIEYDYPNFHLSMDCFWCEIVSGKLELKEHEAAKWLTKESLDSVDWLPADRALIEKINMKMTQNEAKYLVDKAKGKSDKYDQL